MRGTIPEPFDVLMVFGGPHGGSGRMFPGMNPGMIPGMIPRMISGMFPGMIPRMFSGMFPGIIRVNLC